MESIPHSMGKLWSPSPIPWIPPGISGIHPPFHGFHMDYPGEGKVQPRSCLGLWRQVYNAASYQKAFRIPHGQIQSYNLETTINTVIDRASSKSYIVVLPPAVNLVEVQQDLKVSYASPTLTPAITDLPHMVISRLRVTAHCPNCGHGLIYSVNKL